VGAVDRYIRILVFFSLVTYAKLALYRFFRSWLLQSANPQSSMHHHTKRPVALYRISYNMMGFSLKNLAI
jgi:hypothetical protein